jgi:hypothetical protein
MNRVTFLCALAFVASAFPSAVRADNGFLGAYGFPWFGYGNNGPAAYALGNVPTPPYFALHPPVYYSHPIARPYGHSPFACPCHCGHGQIPPAPRVVVNRHVAPPKAEPAPSAAVSVASVPTRIANPFYQAAPPARAELVQLDD